MGSGVRHNVQAKWFLGRRSRRNSVATNSPVFIFLLETISDVAPEIQPRAPRLAGDGATGEQPGS